MSEDITDYLKDGETPLDTIKRERRSTDNLMRHLANAKQRIRELEACIPQSYKEGYLDAQNDESEGFADDWEVSMAKMVFDEKLEQPR